MKILFIEWQGYGNHDLKEAMTAEGHELDCFLFAVSSYTYGTLIEEPETEARLTRVLRQHVPDLVYSTNFYPVISKVCQKERIRYVSWNYDAPNMLLYSEMTANPCNIIYTFDKTECMKYREMGFSHVHYLPLAANTERLDALAAKTGSALPFLYDVSFVGSLYLERTDSFERVEAMLPDRTRGFLKALVAVQLLVREYDFVEALLPDILEDLQRAYPILVQPGLMAGSEAFYEQVVIIPMITAIDRQDLLEAAARYHRVDLFTHAGELELPNVHVHGKVTYEQEMPLIFKQSKINLNITSRSIRSGIPLRAFDIMGAGGFLLSNLQADFLEHFVPEEDFVCYESKKDLLDKTAYYLDHEEERKAIARNGHDKVAAGHTYRHRVREMLGGLP